MRMKSTSLRLILAASFISSIFFSCVPERQFEDLKKKEKSCEDDNARLKTENEQNHTAIIELERQVAELKKSTDDLVKDSTGQGRSYRRLTDLYGELTKSYDKLLSNNEKLLAGNTEETRKLISDLNHLKEDLQRKEDQMRRDSSALQTRENQLEDLKKSLKDREAKVDELQSVLSRSDSATAALKRAVSDALLGFQDKGLTVNERNGRVYVSMEEQLLFASGSTVIEKKGEEALHNLAAVLEKNKDINVLVEGHTDNIPISGTLPSGAKDNWELSVLRATSVTKIILKNTNIEASRISAAGKGPYMPIDPANTAEARKKNRRTEIILSPKLDELMKVLDRINTPK